MTLRVAAGGDITTSVCACVSEDGVIGSAQGCPGRVARRSPWTEHALGGLGLAAQLGAGGCAAVKARSLLLLPELATLCPRPVTELINSLVCPATSWAPGAFWS